MSQPGSQHADLLRQFGERLGAVGGHVHHAAGSTEAAGLIASIVGQAGDRTIWISGPAAERSPALVQGLVAEGVQARIPESAGEVRDQPFGLGVAEAAVAETGSVIMSEPVIEHRAVTLMTDTLVIVCAVETLLPGLDEAAGILRAIGSTGASYATFITGPSRTADIERQLTVGVQGPAVYHVILVDSLT